MEANPAGFFERRKNEYQQRCEIGRMISYHSVIPHMKRRMTIKQFMPFEWEKVETVDLTSDEIDYLNRKTGKYFKDGIGFN